MPKKQTVDGLWTRIDVQSLDKCWPWLGGLYKSGHGQAWWHGKSYCAHRLALWTLGLLDSPSAPLDRKGPGFALHECDNPVCCNPTHIELGTYKKNVNDAYIRGLTRSGFKHPASKLSELDVKEIRNMKGITLRAIADLYNIKSTRTIYKVQQGISYAHNS